VPTSETTWFRVRNWSKFQHYTGRNPPWIKLHYEILTSSDWVALDDSARVLAVACMLIASRNKGEVPNDPGYMCRVAYLKRCDFKPLIANGFLIPASGCKQMLADASVSVSVSEGLDLPTRKEKKDARAPAKPLPEWIDPVLWGEWVQHRHEKKKPLTPMQAEKQWKKLDQYRADGHDPNEIIETAIASGWQGFFPPRTHQGHANGHSNGYETPHDRIKRLNHTDGDDPFAEHDARAASGGDAAPVGPHGRGVRG